MISKLRPLAGIYRDFATSVGTCVLVILPTAHWLPLPGWSYLYVVPVVAVGYAVMRATSTGQPVIGQLSTRALGVDNDEQRSAIGARDAQRRPEFALVAGPGR
jgi:hypothetical protein